MFGAKLGRLKKHTQTNKQRGKIIQFEARAVFLCVFFFPPPPLLLLFAFSLSLSLWLVVDCSVCLLRFFLGWVMAACVFFFVPPPSIRSFVRSYQKANNNNEHTLKNPGNY